MKNAGASVCPPSDAWAKQESLGEALLALARDVGPKGRLPTVRSLCSTFGVSTSTLDPVLRELELRGAIVRQHGRGIFVAPGVSQKTIGVVFGGDIFSTGFSPFWGLLLQAVCDQAEGRALRPQAYLDISGSRGGLGGHAQLIEDLEARRLDGLLLLAPHHWDDEVAQLRQKGVPLVVFSGDGPGWRVTHDVGTFIRLAARSLARAGCRQVALMGHGVIDTMLPLLQNDLRATGAQVTDWSYETWVSRFESSASREVFAMQLAQRMIDGAAAMPLPDSLVSFDDTMTRGAITAFLQAGLRPGRDIRIVTTANKGSPVLDPFADQLVRLEFDPAADMRAALDMLGILMAGGTPPVNPVLVKPRRETRRGTT